MSNILHKRISNKSIFEKDLIPPFPQKNMLIEVTNNCNHKCIFCANSKMTRSKGFINKDFVYKVLEEAYELGTREVGFYATGEPLLNKDIFLYVEQAKNIGYEYVYLTTNGALLNQDCAMKLIEAGIDSIKISINAGTPETYFKVHGRNDFDTVVANISFISEYRKNCETSLHLYASCILNSLNIHEKEQLKRIIGTKVDEIFFLNVRNQGGMMYEVNKELMLDDDSLYVNSRIPCSMLFNSLTITHEGYLTPCCVDFQNYLVVADLNKMSLKDAWQCDVLKNLRKMHIEKQVKGTICYNCIYNKKDDVKPILPEYATII